MSPPPHTPSIETTLPAPTNTDDTHPQPWRPNGVPMRRRVKARFSRAEQVTSTRATVGATHAPACSHEGDRGGLSTRLLLQQRCGTQPAWPCAPAGSRTCRQRHAPRSIVSLLEALAATVFRSLRAASRQPSSRRPARKRRVCPQPRVETAGTSLLFQARGQRQDSNLWRETS